MSCLSCAECSCSSAHAVPFNQRLLSSTPAGTPKRKRLVERQGVLFLNGSTETQILNSTDTAAAVRPPSPPRPFIPCLSRGDVQFAAAVHSSSSSSVAGSCDADTAPAAAHPLYSLASSHSVPYRVNSAPCYSTVHSAASQPPSTSQAPIYTAAGNSCHPVSSSLADGTDYDQQFGVSAPPAIGQIHSRFTGVYGTNAPSVGFTAAHTATDQFHLPVRPSQDRNHPNVPCICTYPVLSTNVMSSVVASDHSRPPVTLTASSSQETIEIHLEPSQGRSKMQEQFTMVRGTTADRNRRRRARSSTMRDHGLSDSAARQPKCQNKTSDGDTKRLISLLRQFKTVIASNCNAEVAQLLSEVCDAAHSSPLLPAPQSAQAAVNHSSPMIEQLQSDIVHLNRLDCSCFDLTLHLPRSLVGIYVYSNCWLFMKSFCTLCSNCNIVDNIERQKNVQSCESAV